MRISKETIEALYQDQGLTVRQCAEVLGLPTHGPIQWALKKYGIPTRPAGFQKGNRKPGDRLRERHGSWKGGKQECSCAQCGATLLRFPSVIHERNFCNHECYGAWKTEHFVAEKNPNFGNAVLVGKNNPNWKGGISHEPYAPIFADPRFKAGIRERDGRVCQNPECRGTSERLTVHHIDYDKKNCDPANLITICVSCNARANFNRDFWEAGYRAIVESKRNLELLQEEARS